jgi:hypothetical protein
LAPASCSSTASTVLSTPPETPQTICLPGDLLADAVDDLALEVIDAERQQVGGI